MGSVNIKAMGLKNKRRIWHSNCWWLGDFAVKMDEQPLSQFNKLLLRARKVPQSPLIIQHVRRSGPVLTNLAE